MRVYCRGQRIPMDQVTMDMMCQLTTLVTDEDPEVHPPVDMVEWRKELLSRAYTSLGLSNAPLHLQGGATAEPCNGESGCSALNGGSHGKQ